MCVCVFEFEVASWRYASAVFVTSLTFNSSWVCAFRATTNWFTAARNANVCTWTSMPNLRVVFIPFTIHFVFFFASSSDCNAKYMCPWMSMTFSTFISTYIARDFFSVFASCFDYILCSVLAPSASFKYDFRLSLDSVDSIERFR